MSCELVELIGSPQNAGFATFLDWRAQLARVNYNLVIDREDIGALTIDTDKLNNLPMADWVALYSHPLVLAYLAELHSEHRSYEDLTDLAKGTLASLSGFDHAFRSIGNSNCKVLAARPNTPVILNALKMKGKGSRKEHCRDAKLLLDDHSAYRRYQAQICEALDKIKSEVPGYYADFERSVQYIVLTTDASFRGSSSLYHLGLIYFCPDDTWTVLKWAEELVHESAHQILEYLAFENRLFLSKEATSALKFDAPLRADKRPAYGILHALFVVARINNMYASIAIPADEMPKVTAYLTDILNRSKETLEVLKETNLLSPFGRKVIDEYITPNLAWKMQDTSAACGRVLI